MIWDVGPFLTYPDGINDDNKYKREGREEDSATRGVCSDARSSWDRTECN